MNASFVVSLLIVAVLFTSIGWFLASVALSQSIRDDLASLEAERYALDEEREMLNRYWTLDVQPPHREVEFDIGQHKRLPEVLS